MHIHILGICGTFMGGVALLARELGHTVSGSDENVYPPMSTQLKAQGISLMQGYAAAHLQPAPDCVVIGNAMSRGNPAVEYVLDQGLRYTSGPQWLVEHVLQDRWVLAVAGTHGKSSTSSLLAWILEANDLAPGFLIGGIPANFGVSARLGNTPFFVVEADEYDTAFFDKRSKFVHYHPRTLVLNNLEFDHADIFPDLQAIKTQFHHLIRTVPGTGLIVSNAGDEDLDDVLQQGCWSELERFGVQQGDWRAANSNNDCTEFDVFCGDKCEGHVSWTQMGLHNMSNALAAIAAARHAGIPAALAAESIRGFKGIKRRMEVRGTVAGVRVYDDFAHHPTAIATTLNGLRRHVGDAPILAVLEPRSNTMRMGVHNAGLARALADADKVYLSRPAGIDWDMTSIVDELNGQGRIFDNAETIIQALMEDVSEGSHVLIMSNGGFENIHARLLQQLEQVTEMKKKTHV